MKLTREQCQAYWRDYPDAESYIGTRARTDFLVGQLQVAGVDNNDTVLELGCGLGRNLDRLISSGYTHLIGVDISQKAIEIMKTVYPKAYALAHIECCALEDYDMPEVDWVYTMACLEHIPLESVGLFSRIAHCCKKGLVTIEDEYGHSKRHFSRDYGQVFNHYGYVHLGCTRCTHIEGLGKNFISRVMIRGRLRHGIRALDG